MKIDCKKLACPEPVLRAKKALEDLEEGVLEVIVDNEAAKENVMRYASSLGYESKFETKNDQTVVTIVKGFECSVVKDEPENLAQRTLFIKDDKVGEGELGCKLIVGFLNSIAELDQAPKEIICVNRGVFLTTQNDMAVEALKKLAQKGVEIYSCGVCLEFYGVQEELKVGVVGNAFATVEMLTKSKGVISL